MDLWISFKWEFYFVMKALNTLHMIFKNQWERTEMGKRKIVDRRQGTQWLGKMGDRLSRKRVVGKMADRSQWKEWMVKMTDRRREKVWVGKIKRLHSLPI